MVNTPCSVELRKAAITRAERNCRNFRSRRPRRESFVVPLSRRLGISLQAKRHSLEANNWSPPPTAVDARVAGAWNNALVEIIAGGIDPTVAANTVLTWSVVDLAG